MEKKAHNSWVTPYNALSPVLMKTARALLNVTQDDLAKEVDISVSTIRRFESGRGLMNAEHSKAILAHFKDRGLAFVVRNAVIVGVLKGDHDNITFDC